MESALNVQYKNREWGAVAKAICICKTNTTAELARTERQETDDATEVPQVNF